MSRGTKNALAASAVGLYVFLSNPRAEEVKETHYFTILCRYRFSFSFHYLYNFVRVAYFNHSSSARIVFTVSQKQIFFFFFNFNRTQRICA